MGVRRQRLTLGVVIAGLVVVQAIVVNNAGAQDPKSQRIPVTLWTAAGITGTGVDGVGSLMAPVTVPAPAAGQSTENKWAYALLFRFVGSTAPFGVVSLDTDGNQKFATLSINNGAAEPVVETERFTFNWQKDRFYLPMVVMLPGNAVAAFVYDYTNAAWTFVGVIRTQVAWGELSPASATLPIWYGSELEDCALYSRADFFAYAPYAFDAGATITSASGGDFVTEGDCPASVTPASDPNFRRYEAGSATAPTTTTSASTTTTGATTTTTVGSTTTTSSTTTTTLISTTLPSVTTTLPLGTTTTQSTTTTTTGG